MAVMKIMLLEEIHSMLIHISMKVIAITAFEYWKKLVPIDWATLTSDIQFIS